MRDLQPNGEAKQVTVFGKGGKTRVVVLKASIWTDLAWLRGADPDGVAFRSREGDGTLDPSQVHRTVKRAAQRDDLSDRVSAHWLRHAHVSHVLDRGAPIHLVQATVGHASLATTSRYAHARPTDSSSRYLPA
jgi:site-specific recombinase XerD